MKLPFLLAITCAASAVDWPFDTDENPAISGTAAAYVAPGDFSTGWWGEPFLLTTNSGFWDLGQSGQVTASLEPANRITVTVLQWIDHAGIFNDFTAIEVGGFTNIYYSVTEMEPSPLLGGWCQQTVVLVGNLTQAPQLTVNGVENGTLLNRLTVTCEVIQTAPAPRRVNRRVKANQL